MKKIVLFFSFITLFTIRCFSQCPNADFSMGNFTNWTGSTGYYALGVYYPYGGMIVGTQNTNSYAADLGRQTIMTQSMIDPETNGGLNVLPPGGGFSARLGNPRTASCDTGKAQEEELSYTYAVNSNNCIFTYEYAVVLHDPGSSANHTALTRPKFSIHVLNSSGVLVDSICGYYEVIAQQGNPGFVSCNADPADACDNSDVVVWKNWTPVNIDLSSYIGQTVTVQFATRDCNPNEHAGRHFGYAYIHCGCGSFTLTQQCVGTSDLITAPAGYVSYDWSYINTSGSTTAVTTATDTLTVNPVPNGHTITCVCTSVTGCKYTYTLPLSIDIPVFTPAAPTICSGQTATITASGQGSYVYNWNIGISDSTISVNPTSTTAYTVTATASGGCSSSSSVNVTVNPLPAGPITSTPENCGAGDGTITVTPNVGTSPFGFTWNTTPAQTSQTATGLPQGSYTVTVSDANGCTSTLAGTIAANPNISLTSSSTDEYCSQANGTANVSATGGTPPLIYTWSTTPPQTSANVSNLAAGTYTVTVTDGVCSATAQVTIANFPPPTLQVVSIKDETCSAGNGGATVQAANGTPGYNYVWSCSPAQNTAIMQNVSAGTYAVTVTDTKGCTASTTVTIKNYPPQTLTITNIAPEACNFSNGSISVNVNGGTGPFQYLWNTVPPQTTITASNIPHGTYTVTVTDSVGCVATASGIVPFIPGPTITGTPQSETCAGLSNGSVSITVNSPSLPITYLWSTNATTQNISSLPGGTYTVTVTDNVGCTNTSTFTVGTHPIINLTTSSTNAHCNRPDGSASVNATGGSGGFTYIWSNSQNTQSISNQLAGTYTVTVTDGFCTSTASVTIANIPGPTVSITNVLNETCTAGNGSATALPTGGTSPYSYLWNCSPSQNTATMLNVHAGNYTVTLTDINSCTATNNVIITNAPGPTLNVINTVSANCGFSNGAANINVNGGTAPFQYSWNTSPPQNTLNASNVPSGTYTVTVTDANNCTATVPAIVSQLPGPTATTTGLPEICSRGNGSATATGNGGYVPPNTYTYTWNTAPPQVSQNATNLSAGTYTCVISDGGCTTSASVIISNIPGPNAYFLVHPKVLSYLDGPVSFQDASTGTVVNWQWELGDGSSASTTDFWHQYNGIGTYPVILIVTDTNGCKDTIVDTVKVHDIFTFYVPNCFTPNGDGIDDYFFPTGVNWDPNDYEFYIFDRWGNLVFQTNDIKGKWDGTVNNSGKRDSQVIDVYVYLVHVREMNMGPKHEYKGTVTLIK